jgi:hypothetical protein
VRRLGLRWAIFYDTNIICHFKPRLQWWLIGFVTTYRCKCQGKICSLVIDSESCANIVSLEMVNKLKLKAEPHPKPYEISWFKKSGEVKLSY